MIGEKRLCLRQGMFESLDKRSFSSLILWILPSQLGGELEGTMKHVHREHPRLGLQKVLSGGDVIVDGCLCRLMSACSSQPQDVREARTASGILRQRKEPLDGVNIGFSQIV